jgi:hypothetical protein
MGRGRGRRSVEAGNWRCFWLRLRLARDPGILLVIVPMISADGTSALVRLGVHHVRTVEVRPCRHAEPAVANRNCVAERRGGKQRRANWQSVAEWRTRFGLWSARACEGWAKRKSRGKRQGRRPERASAKKGRWTGHGWLAAECQEDEETRTRETPGGTSRAGSQSRHMSEEAG